MSSEPVFPNYMPVEDYLEFDGYRDIRYEYVGGYLYAMVGASRRHNLIVSGISARLWQAAQGTTCQVFSSAMRLRVASDVYYYPDIVVTCRADDVAEHYIEHPCLIFEVLSPATQSRDRGEKLLAYRQIDALKTFLIVHQDDMRVERHWRDDSGTWQRVDVISPGAHIPLRCLDLELRLTDIYANLPEA